eukprot:364076-Chlamydomonas_euryale.AAC.10
MVSPTIELCWAMLRRCRAEGLPQLTAAAGRWSADSAHLEPSGYFHQRDGTQAAIEREMVEQLA